MQTSTTEIYPLPLHDALPISRGTAACAARGTGGIAARRTGCAAAAADAAGRASAAAGNAAEAGGGLRGGVDRRACVRSEEHTSELQSHVNLVCRLLLEKKKKI